MIETILDRLTASKDAIRHQWDNPDGTATRHFAVDDLLPEEVCRRIYEAFPKNKVAFEFTDSPRERKWASAYLKVQKPLLTEITYAIQDPRVLQVVADITGIAGLEPDPMLYAGGLSMMFQGDFLNPHIDNSHDGKRERYRRLNLLYYVTPDWSLEDGGHLELWDAKGTVPVTLQSKFNRLIVMETNKSSLHSVSPVVGAGPRCCVSNYYFSEQSPDGGEYFHVTSFTGRPEEKLKRMLAPIDNGLRQAVATALKTGRGKHLVNQ